MDGAGLVSPDEARAMSAIVELFSRAMDEGRPLPAWQHLVSLYQQPRGPLPRRFLEIAHAKILDRITATEESNAILRDLEADGGTQYFVDGLGLSNERVLTNEYRRELKQIAKRRSGVPLGTKQEICWFLQQGEPPEAVGEVFGYEAPDVVRIAASFGVTPKPRPAPPAPVVEVAPVEPDPAPTVALDFGKDGCHSIQLAPKKRGRATPKPVDLIAEGEHLFYAGEGAESYRVEYSPYEEERLRRDLNALKFETVKGSSVTEYDILSRNIMSFADGLVKPSASGSRLKFFKDQQGRTFYEFKGFQARLFVALTVSRYPDGREVRRCALLFAYVKKRDVHKGKELDRAADAADAWRAWREQQDAAIGRKLAS